MKKWKWLFGSALALSLVACGNGDSSNGNSDGSDEVDVSALPEPGDFETQETLIYLEWLLKVAS